MNKLTTLFILAIATMFFATGCSTKTPQATNNDIYRALAAQSAAINNLADSINKKEVTPEIPATKKNIQSAVSVDEETNNESETYSEEEIVEDDAAVAGTDNVKNESADGVLTDEDLEEDPANASNQAVKKKVKKVKKKKKVKKELTLAERVAKLERNDWRQDRQIADNRDATNRIGWYVAELGKDVKTVAVGYFRKGSSKAGKNIKKHVEKIAAGYKVEIDKRSEEDGHKYSVDLKLIGFADVDGEEEKNKKLSLERAKTVQALFIEALEAQGISGKIEVAGEGETEKWFTKDNARCVVIENTFVKGDLIEVATVVEEENEND